jgi:hypothetical protein
VGSGYYVVSLNAGQCAVKKAGAYGCTVDANGDPTECGAMVVNDAIAFEAGSNRDPRTLALALWISDSEEDGCT